MAQITITFQDSTGTGTTNVTLSDADINRMVNVHRELYAVDGTLATKQQALKGMAKAALQLWKDNTRSHEHNKSVAAVPPIPDIPITEVP